MRDLVWRDDDVSYLTDLAQFKKVDKIFQERNVQHTIAIIMYDIERNGELINYIKANNIDVQLHCWSHRSMPHILDELQEELEKSVLRIEELFGKKPTTLYPPWNRANAPVIEIAEKIGLRVSTIKSSVSNYYKNEGNIEEEVINFHYWNDGDIMFLPQALDIYNLRKSRCVGS